MNDKDLRSVAKALEKLKEKYPDVEIYIEAPNNGTSCRLGDAMIYVAMNGKVAIDAE